MVCSLHYTPHEFVCRGTCDSVQWQNWGNTKITRRSRRASIAVATDQDLDRDFAPLRDRRFVVVLPPRTKTEALTDLIAGQIEVLFPSLGPSIEYVKTGKLRALAVTGATRTDAVPDLPTVAETLPGYQAASFYGIGAPAIPRPRLSRF